MIEYKAVYAREDGTSYYKKYIMAGTRYEVLMKAQELKESINDVIVYIRTKEGGIVLK